MKTIHEIDRQVSSPEFQQAFDKAMEPTVPQSSVDGAAAAVEADTDAADRRAQQAAKAGEKRVKTIEDVIDSPEFIAAISGDDGLVLNEKAIAYASRDELEISEGGIRMASRDELEISEGAIRMASRDEQP